MRVLLVDDHEVVRIGLREVLAADPALVVVAEANSGEQALAAAAVHQPDVVVMDLHMDGMGGIEAMRRLLAAQPETVVVVLTMFEDDDSVFAALEAGARGYLLKGAGSVEVRAALRAAHVGNATFDSTVADRVLERALRVPERGTTFPSLTRREHDILEAMVNELDPPQIGRQLGISEKTVRNNISTILAKLQVADREAAVATAVAAGMRRTSSRRAPVGEDEE